MLKQILIASIIMFLSVIQVSAIEVGGIELPDTMKAGGSDLILNGAGLRRKFGIKVYAAALYLKAKNSNSAAIMNADEPMVLIMKWRRKVPPEKINDVFFESFATSVQAPEQNVYSPDSDYGPLKGEIVKFMKWISVKKTQKNDTWTYRYLPGKGTEVYINTGTGDVLAGTIPGLEFKKALFGIWIGEHNAVGSGLKEDLLGMD